jgi:hypothetical protein
MASAFRRLALGGRRKTVTSGHQPANGRRAQRLMRSGAVLLVVCLLVGILDSSRSAEAACGTYVLVAGQAVVHEMLPYQPPWQVLNEPQMTQLLTHRWSIDFAVIPPCDDCRCDGRPSSEPLPPATAPGPRDVQPVTEWSSPQTGRWPDTVRRGFLMDSCHRLPGHPLRIARPPEGLSVVFV